MKGGDTEKGMGGKVTGRRGREGRERGRREGESERALLPSQSLSLLSCTPPGSLVHLAGLYISPIFPVSLTRYQSLTIPTNTLTFQVQGHNWIFPVTKVISEELYDI